MMHTDRTSDLRQLQANCYLSKPVELHDFESLVKSISEFWLTMVRLPPAVAA